MTDRFALAAHDRLFDDTAATRMRPLSCVTHRGLTRDP